MLVAVAAAHVLLDRPALAALVAVEKVGMILLAMSRLLVRQTQAVAVVAGEDLPIVLRLVGLVWSSSVTQTLLMTLLQLRDRHPSATQAGLKFIAGLVLVQLHSEVTHGTLCTA
jgi:hypothetical protein